MNAATLFALLAMNTPAHGGPPPGGPPGAPHGGPHGGPHGRPVATCPANVVQAFDALDAALRHTARDVENVKRKQDRAHLRAELANALQRSQDARRVACREARDDRPDVIVVQPPPPPVVVVLDDRGHRELVSGVRREPFDEGRLGILELGLRDACVTSTQAKDLVRELTFSSGKLHAVRLLAPRIVDRDRSHLVLESFTFDSDKRAARDILLAASPAGHCALRRV